MKTIANLIWLIFGGLASAIGFLFAGLLWCITIIGIPFGLQAFKMATLVLMPFGKKVNTNFGKHPIANLLWFIFGGFAMMLGQAFLGLLFCITVVGIPFGLQIFKMAKLSAIPFGATVTG
jgi:uncharacterized membrane protein YccF (DUF307 family)